MKKRDLLSFGIFSSVE